MSHTQELLPSPIDDHSLTPPSSIKRTINQPMVVDITIGDDGKQVYQLQDLKTSSRKRTAENDTRDSKIKKITPRRTTRNHFSPESLAKNCKKSKTPSSSDSKLKGSPTGKGEPEVNVWSDEVESAFEQALRIIPKNGLTKIKISGKSCGRNELISDYIFQKTGALRTRKQVSSHIQVIKNLGKRTDLVALINKGPSDLNAQAVFDEVFSEISFKKSLGNAALPASNADTETSKIAAAPSTSSFVKIETASPTLEVASSESTRNFKDVEFTLKRFEISYIDYGTPCNSHIYSKFSSGLMDKTLRLKPTAKIENRFPNLKDYVLNDHIVTNQDENIPLLHNLVQLQLPSPQRILNGQHDVILHTELKNIPLDSNDFGCMTIIYSFGNEIIKTYEGLEVVKRGSSSHPSLSIEMKFAKEFWTAFFQSMDANINVSEDKSDSQKTIAIKAVTMMQVIFSKTNTKGFNKDNIKGIILWEFTRSYDTCETTSRRLYLPHASQQNIGQHSQISNKSSPTDFKQNYASKPPFSFPQFTEFNSNTFKIDPPPPSHPEYNQQRVSSVCESFNNNILPQTMDHTFRRVQSAPVVSNHSLWNTQHLESQQFGTEFPGSTTSSVSTQSDFLGFMPQMLSVQGSDMGAYGIKTEEVDGQFAPVAQSNEMRSFW